jgi:16S rRNA (guanine527-N7)-methyltransferase
VDYCVGAQDDDGALIALLARGLVRMGLEVPVVARYHLLAYLHLLMAWNERHNVTAIKSLSAAVSLHLLDSLAILPWLQAQAFTHLIDLGSGGGLPGIPLAIVRPLTLVSLLESRGKRAFFLQHVCATLRLHHVRVLRGRAQVILPYKLAHTLVVCRAVAPLDKLLQMAHSFLRLGCVLGVYWGRGVVPDHLRTAYHLERCLLPSFDPDIARYLLLVRLR